MNEMCQGAANPEGYISTLSGSSVVFHWPRNDYDQLLCVRLMDTPNCTWSGGFEVNKPRSFHVNMRCVVLCAHAVHNNKNNFQLFSHMSKRSLSDLQVERQLHSQVSSGLKKIFIQRILQKYWNLKRPGKVLEDNEIKVMTIFDHDLNLDKSSQKQGRVFLFLQNSLSSSQQTGCYKMWFCNFLFCDN